MLFQCRNYLLVGLIGNPTPNSIPFSGLDPSLCFCTTLLRKRRSKVGSTSCQTYIPKALAKIELLSVVKNSIFLGLLSSFYKNTNRTSTTISFHFLRLNCFWAPKLNLTLLNRTNEIQNDRWWKRLHVKWSLFALKETISATKLPISAFISKLYHLGYENNRILKSITLVHTCSSHNQSVTKNRSLILWLCHKPTNLLIFIVSIR